MKRAIGALFFAAVATTAVAQLAPPPAPVENQLAEQKRILGKILFWDEQLSSDDTVACGTCHIPGNGGADPRVGLHPGSDGTFGTADDVNGSPGVARADPLGVPVADPAFGFAVQVTGRAANAAIGAAYAPELFHDGRAATTFTDPETGSLSIATGGALESQAVGPILSDVEMAREGRTWDDVRVKLSQAVPLGDASDLPPDVAAALASNPSYADLFQDAFGDPAINAARIAYAIATYERTLVADQTPWDAFVSGNTGALTANQQQGWADFQALSCNACHSPPEFTDHSYRNIGIRPPGEDSGRQEVTGLAADRGKFKVPTLRNSGLRVTFMHNGRVATMNAAVNWYRTNNPARFTDNLDPLVPVPINAMQRQRVTDFIVNGLTDPRVAAEQFPFDRPVLHGGAMRALDFGADDVTLTWQALEGAQSYNVYRGNLLGLIDADANGIPDGGFGDCVSDVDPDDTDTMFADPVVPVAGEGFFYLKSMIDGQAVERGLGATSAGLPRRVALSCP